MITKLTSIVSHDNETNLNWALIIPRDVSLSDSQCKLILSGHNPPRSLDIKDNFWTEGIESLKVMIGLFHIPFFFIAPIAHSISGIEPGGRSRYDNSGVPVKNFVILYRIR